MKGGFFMRKNICIIGPLGAGKSTCISILEQENNNLIGISSGKLIRAAGIDISNGELINDKLVVSLIYTEMSKTSKTILHDGFPRTVKQGLEFLELGEKIDCVIYLNVPFSELYVRVNNRLICSNPLCQETYSLKNIPKLYNKLYYCKRCNSILTVRADDNINAIKKRFDIFNSNLNDIISFCKIYNIPFFEINAKGQTDKICSEILNILKGFIF